MDTHTLLVFLGALIGDTASNVTQEGLGLANTGNINPTFGGNRIGGAGFLYIWWFQ